MTSLTILLVLSGLVAMAAAHPADREDMIEMIQEELRRGQSEGRNVDLSELRNYLEEILKGTTTASPPTPGYQLKTALLQALTGRTDGDSDDSGMKLAMLQELIKEMHGNEGDDSWSVHLQQGCEIPAVDCGEPPSFINGQVSYSSTMEGSLATYTCDEQFYLNGSASRTCGNDGTWSSKEPVCQLADGVVGCEQLPSLNNGRLSYSGPTMVGSEATVSCYRKYYRDGPATRTCQSDGSWSGRRTYCRGCKKWLWKCSSTRECCGTLVCKSYFWAPKKCHLF